MDWKEMLFTIYKFSNSQSKSVILHRMYFHCRSLKRSKRQSPVSSAIINYQTLLFILFFVFVLPINSGPTGLAREIFFFQLSHERISTIFGWILDPNCGLMGSEVTKKKKNRCCEQTLALH